ncbi:unnamed protein product [Caenorhabditis auriculariae]|uniref:Uncharacterized protein n=1 Tax=Caenorhabditis auriculariae TaxID=2777116 RepID=A0A8S1HQZ3_9PELO|nr:unnamed protein product [Caenorhabditis auriculariae]
MSVKEGRGQENSFIRQKKLDYSARVQAFPPIRGQKNGLESYASLPAMRITNKTEAEFILAMTTAFSLSFTFIGKINFYSDYILFIREPTIDCFPINLQTSYLILWVSGAAMQTSIICLFECRHHEFLPEGHWLKLKNRNRIIFRTFFFVYYFLSGVPAVVVGRPPKEEFLRNRVLMISLQGMGLLHINMMSTLSTCGAVISLFVWDSCRVMRRYNLHLSENTKRLQKGYLKSLIIMVVTPLVTLLGPAIVLIPLCTMADCQSTDAAAVAASLFSAYGVVTSILIITIHRPYRRFIYRIVRGRNSIQKAHYEANKSTNPSVTLKVTIEE